MTPPALSASSAPAPRASPDRFRKWFIFGVAIALTIWGLTDVRSRARTIPDHPLLHRTDFTCYTEAGAAFFDGRDPYKVTNIRGWGYPYPPLLAIFVAPLAPLNTQAQALVWFFLCLLFCFGCYHEGRRLLACFAPKQPEAAIFPSWIGWLALATVALPVLNCLQRGQVGILKAYFLLLGLRLIVESRSWWRSMAGGVFLTLPIAVKITPILPVGIFLFSEWVRTAAHWRTEPRWDRTLGATAGVCLGLVLFFLLIPSVFIGWDANLHHLDTWYREVVTRVNDLNDADRTGNTRTVRNQSLSNAVYRLGNFLVYEFAGGPDDQLADDTTREDNSLPMDAEVVDQALFFVRVGLMVLLLAAATVTAWRGDDLGQAVVFGLATAATLIVAPIGRGHYFMLLLPALLLAPCWLWQRNRRRAALAVAVVPLALLLAHYLALDIAGRLGVLGIGTTVWYVAAIVPLLAIRRPPNLVANHSRPSIGAQRRAA